ncbi:hypothetical protein Vretifemale_18589, partial [Volvox reticuliferus]
MAAEVTQLCTSVFATVNEARKNAISRVQETLKAVSARYLSDSHPVLYHSFIFNALDNVRSGFGLSWWHQHRACGDGCTGRAHSRLTVEIYKDIPSDNIYDQNAMTKWPIPSATVTATVLTDDCERSQLLPSRILKTSANAGGKSCQHSYGKNMAQISRHASHQLGTDAEPATRQRTITPTSCGLPESADEYGSAAVQRRCQWPPLGGHLQQQQPKVELAAYRGLGHHAYEGVAQQQHSSVQQNQPQLAGKIKEEEQDLQHRPRSGITRIDNRSQSPSHTLLAMLLVLFLGVGGGGKALAQSTNRTCPAYTTDTALAKCTPLLQNCMLYMYCPNPCNTNVDRFSFVNVTSCSLTGKTFITTSSCGAITCLAPPSLPPPNRPLQFLVLKQPPPPPRPPSPQPSSPPPAPKQPLSKQPPLPGPPPSPRPPPVRRPPWPPQQPWIQSDAPPPDSYPSYYTPPDEVTFLPPPPSPKKMSPPKPKPPPSPPPPSPPPPPPPRPRRRPPPSEVQIAVQPPPALPPPTPPPLSPPTLPPPPPPTLPPPPPPTPLSPPPPPPPPPPP